MIKTLDIEDVALNLNKLYDSLDDLKKIKATNKDQASRIVRLRNKIRQEIIDTENHAEKYFSKKDIEKMMTQLEYGL